MLMNEVWPGLFAPYRVEKYTAFLLNESDEIVGELGTISGGTFTTSTDARIKSSAKIDVVTKEPIMQWAGVRVKLFAHVNDLSWPLGVFIPSSPTQKHTATGVVTSVELLDKLTILDHDLIDASLSVPAGTDLIGFITEMIENAGESHVRIVKENHVNKKPYTWDAGTPKLTVINDILDSAGYFSLSADPDGYLTTQPYLVPKERPIAWEISQGELSMFSPEFTHTWDLDGIPNKIVYIAQSTGYVTLNAATSGDPNKTVEVKIEGTTTAPPMVAVATNEDPDSPFSYQARGRWIVETSNDVKAENQDILNKKAQRRLDNALDPMESVELRHAIIPARLNQLAHFRTRDYDFVASVRKMEISFSPGELMTLKLRKVNYADLEPSGANAE